MSGAHQTALTATLGGGIPVDLTRPADNYWPEIPDHDLDILF